MKKEILARVLVPLATLEDEAEPEQAMFIAGFQEAIKFFKLHDKRDHQCKELADALSDMLSGWRYIRETHGDLYGVGWDRAESKAREALKNYRG